MLFLALLPSAHATLTPRDEHFLRRYSMELGWSCTQAEAYVETYLGAECPAFPSPASTAACIDRLVIRCEYDGDGDGVGPFSDCDDTDPSIHPGAPETCSDLIDQDCDGLDDACTGETFLLPDDAHDALSDTEANAGFGVALTTGDFNGDGVTDLAVGAGGKADPSATVDNGAGQVLLYAGGSAGIATSTFASVVGYPTGPYSGASNLGWSLGNSGDVDGDGFDDLFARAPGIGYDSTGALGAAAYGLYGPLSGGMSVDAASLAYCDGMESYAWSDVDSGGDLTGDGLDDAIMANYATAALTGTSRTGFVHVFGVADPAPCYTSEVNYTYSTSTSGAGGSSAAILDYSGDGLDDLVVGGRNTRRAWVMEGPISGGVPMDAAFAVLGDATSSSDMSVARTGDVNGDGVEDVLVGDYQGAGYGQAWLFTGGAAGAVSTSAAEASLTGRNSNSFFGAFLGNPGDVNGDGLAEVMVGAEYDAGSGGGRSSTAVWYGPIAGTYSGADADMLILGTSVAVTSGRGMAGGDLDDDGLSDLAVGAHNYYSSETAWVGLWYGAGL